MKQPHLHEAATPRPPISCHARRAHRADDIDASSDDETLRAFRRAFEDHIAVPCDAFVIGEPVSVIEFGYDGNARRGLTARCRRDDGAQYVVAAAEVVLARRTDSGHYLAAYRRWLGLDPHPSEAEISTRPLRRHRAAATDLNLGGPIELVALSVKDKAVRCRVLGATGSAFARAASGTSCPAKSS